MAPCFNWTTDRLLQQYPLAFSIETKRYGGNTAKGEQQMGIWHAAQWEFLISRTGSVATNKLEFLPGVVVQGHIWSLVITTRSQAITVCGDDYVQTNMVLICWDRLFFAVLNLEIPALLLACSKSSLVCDVCENGLLKSYGRGIKRIYLDFVSSDNFTLSLTPP
jgi:hypothetical protein